MNTRRKFLLQGGMATTALIAAKPFETFAKITAPVTGFSVDNNSLLLLHSNNMAHQNTVKNIAALKGKHANVAVFNTGTGTSEKLKADATVNASASFLPTENNYSIIHKGNVKIGVLSVDHKENNAGQVNSVATYLKKDKKCDLVICLSQLGFKNRSGIDDMQLAEASVNIDVVLGGHSTNNTNTPHIVLNKDQHEVIIDHSAATDVALGQIAIQFNNKKQKVNIAF